MRTEPGEIEVVGDPVPDGLHGPVIVTGLVEFKNGEAVGFHPLYKYPLHAVERHGERIVFECQPVLVGVGDVQHNA